LKLPGAFRTIDSLNVEGNEIKLNIYDLPGVTFNAYCSGS